MQRDRLIADLRRNRGDRRHAAGATPTGPRFPLLFGGESLTPWTAPSRGCSRWCSRPDFTETQAVISEGNYSPCKAFPWRHTDSRLVLIARPDILCSRGPEAMRAKAADLDLAAAAKTVGVQPAADQVAAAMAAILLSHAQIYQDISTQMAAFHDQLVENRTADSTSYASAEANAQQSLLNAMDAPSWQQRRETVGEVGLPADPAGSGTATAAVAAATTARAGSRSAAQATVAPIGGLKLRRESALSQPGDLHHHVEVGDALPRVDPFQRGNVGVVAAYTHTDVLLGDLIVIGGVVVPPSTGPGLNPGMAAPVYRLSHHGITLRV